ncbi:MAG TPA: ABC transporter ATP-binding protein [Solirubrobacteraceae bacterium]|nr:ABC transporter ATP-binding protein [Solirubrobacteraceae bacterium]
MSFEIEDGELFTLLGPSGCGKTTTLLSIAGFVKPDGGAIRCDGATFVDADAKLDVPAERRNLGMVFQSYAVWPHMTIADNVAFPLKIRKANKRARQAKVVEALELVELSDLADRYPHQISGGQRQRVALARALVYEPSVLLLDEPFSNLDAKLRERARSWLKRLQHQLGLTTVFVTHDQDEAMQLSDRILVMDQGRIQQIATPEDIYHRPANAFVASFLGRCNLLRGLVRDRRADGASEIALSDDHGSLFAAQTDVPIGTEVTVALRPEAIRLFERPDNGPTGVPERANVFEVTVREEWFLGDHYEYALTAGDVEFTAQGPRHISAPTLSAVIEPAACAVISDGPHAHANGRPGGGRTTGETNGNGSAPARYSAVTGTEG